MQDYGAIIPAEDLPIPPEYDTGKSLLVSEDPPIIISHDMQHNYVPNIDYDAYIDEGTSAVVQFFTQVISDLDRLNEHGKDGVPVRVVLNHAVNHTGLTDDEAYEILMELANKRQDPVQLDKSGRVTAD
jgi:hypothetical protein